MNVDELYQEELLDHAKHPTHRGVCEGFTHQARGRNPLCGDELAITLRLENGRIADVKFEGRGCVISQASASVMTESLRGATPEEVEARLGEVRKLLTTRQDVRECPHPMVILKGVRAFPTRIKCALLAWHTVEEALRSPVRS